MMRIVSVAAMALFLGGPAIASEYDEALKALAADKLKAIAADPALIAEVKAQNAAHAGLSEAEILALDKKWRAEVGVGDRPTIDKVINAPSSANLVAARDESEGLFTEIFAMDNRGLNVAASDVTSDYWQGDEAKWRETFLVGPDALHLSEVELDESTQSYQAQVSLTLVDPSDGAAVGAITFGVSVEGLE